MNNISLQERKPMALTGRATAAATKNYADTVWQNNPKISPNSWKLLEGLTIGEVGCGTYRLEGQDVQIEALKKALLNGVNLIDTSSNYMDGYSEATIGYVLMELANANKLSREQTVIISKVGYLQGTALEQYRKTPPKEYVEINDQLWHCIHPDFLEQQIEGSLKRLNVDTIDGYLLHNPEYYLQWALGQNMSKKEAQHEYYRRIQEAFVFLERMCKENKIAFYGISSNTFISNKDAYEFTDLQKIQESAQFAALEAWGRRKRPLFRCIQLPYNLLEPGAVREINTTAKIIDGEENVSTLELATRMRLAVLANRPLNAFPRPEVALRLIDKPDHDMPLHSHDILEQVSELETKLSEILGGWPAFNNQPMFSLANQGKEVINQLENSIHLDYVFHMILMPQMKVMQNALDILAQEHSDKQQLLDTVKNAYQQAGQALFQTLKHEMRIRDSERVKAISMEVKSRVPENWQEAPLQQIALNAIASTPGITCVLNGMRESTYVDDAINVMQRSDFIDAGAVIGTSV